MCEGSGRGVCVCVCVQGVCVCVCVCMRAYVCACVGGHSLECAESMGGAQTAKCAASAAGGATSPRGQKEGCSAQQAAAGHLLRVCVCVYVCVRDFRL